MSPSDPLKDLLAKGDKAIARAERDRRPKSDPPESEDWDLITARHEIEELKEAVKRAPLPSSPEINVNVHLDSGGKKSDPPKSVRAMFSKEQLPKTLASIALAAAAAAAAVAQACQGIPHP